MPSRKQKEKQAAHALDDFVGAVLLGAPITEADLEKLVDLKVPEGQRIEYKSEGWTDKAQDKKRKTGKGKPKALQARVAKYMAGFANGTGGVLVIGIAEGKDGTRDNGRPERLDPIPDERRDTVREQVKQGLLKLKGQLPRIEPARFIEADAGGFYVMMGVQRASRLVQVAEPDQLMFYLRVHDTTTYAPDYLAADLVLGRRQQPRIEVEEMPVAVVRGGPENDVKDFSARLYLHNVGFSWLVKPIAGFISPHFPRAPTLPPHLEAEVRVVRPMRGAMPWLSRGQISFPRTLGNEVPPLERVSIHGPRVATTDLEQRTLLWAAALYVVCFNQEPNWYQVVVLWDGEAEPKSLVLPCLDQKPVVALHEYQAGAYHPPIDWCAFGSKLEGFTLLDEPERDRKGEDDA